MLSFRIEATSGRARAGLLATPHGVVRTPAFMPVGTAGAVKALTLRDLDEIGAEIVLANTYHLVLRPGDALLAQLGGLHRFTGWNRPYLTDSGGYQVFSLAPLRRLSEEGVLFSSHLDGTRHLLTPERAIEAQERIGADLIMPLDECCALPSPREVIAAAVDRTARWARRSRDAHRRSDQWLFGIVQGGLERDLRERSARAMVEMDFPGYAIGGLSVGEPRTEMLRVVDQLDAMLPQDRPRYLMGVGTPEEILEAVARGVDLFDCVLPTRNARNGQLFTRAGRLSIRNARHRADPSPPDPACGCRTCRTASRAYLRHLHLAGEIAAATLMTVHNLTHYLDTLRGLRQSILLGRFQEHREEMLRTLAPAGSLEP